MLQRETSAKLTKNVNINQRQGIDAIGNIFIPSGRYDYPPPSSPILLFITDGKEGEGALKTHLYLTRDTHLIVVAWLHEWCVEKIIYFYLPRNYFNLNSSTVLAVSIHPRQPVLSPFYKYRLFLCLFIIWWNGGRSCVSFMFPLCGKAAEEVQRRLKESGA